MTLGANGSFAASTADASRTLGEMHLAAERCKRPVVVGSWQDERRANVPSWRFYRNVIRLSLYFTERAGLRAGDRVVSLAPLRAERFVLEWALLAQGAVSIALDPAVPAAELREAMRELRPRFVLAAGGEELAKLESAAGGGVETTLVLDPVAPSPSSTAWADALELGGTLDTAERAQGFRARARALDPGRLALVCPDDTPGAFRYLTHAQVLAAIARFQSTAMPHAADAAYVQGPGSSMHARIALLSFVGDGMTTTFVGTVGREAVELAELRPQILMVSSDVAAQARRQTRPSVGHTLRHWLDRTLHRDGGESLARPRFRAIMTLDGAHAGLGKQRAGGES